MVQTVRNVFNFASFAFKTDTHTHTHTLTQDKEKEFQIRAYIKTDVLGLISCLCGAIREFFQALCMRKAFSNFPNTFGLYTLFFMQKHLE